MEENIPQEVEKKISLNCKNCGAHVTYSPDKGNLHCEHCGHVVEIPRASDLVVEKSFSEAMSLEDLPIGLGKESKIFKCKACGSQTAVDKEQVSFQCPFCGSANVDESATALRVIQPSGVLPFKVNKKKAEGEFMVWIGKGWFHPNNLKKIAELGKIAGVYVPYWTFDADTQSSWTADAGYYYYVTETYRDANGNTQTRQVQKVRWVPVSGYHEDKFDDVLVVASNGIPQHLSEAVAPFALNEVVNYDSRFILGLNSEIYQKDVKEGFSVGDKIMDQRIEAAIIPQIPGDTHRFLNIHTRKFNITFKHILLPVWIAGYTYKGKIFQYLVNGQTGKAAGQKPLSFWKIFFFVLAILVVIGGIAFLAKSNS